MKSKLTPQNMCPRFVFTRWRRLRQRCRNANRIRSSYTKKKQNIFENERFSPIIRRMIYFKFWFYCTTDGSCHCGRSCELCVYVKRIGYNSSRPNSSEFSLFSVCRLIYAINYVNTNIFILNKFQPKNNNIKVKVHNLTE